MKRSRIKGDSRGFMAAGLALGLAMASAAALAQTDPDLAALSQAVAGRIALVEQLIEREDAKLDALAERMDRAQTPEQKARLAALHEQLTGSLDQLEATKERLAQQLAMLREQARQMEQRHERQR